MTPISITAKKMIIIELLFLLSSLTLFIIYILTTYYLLLTTYYLLLTTYYLLLTTYTLYANLRYFSIKITLQGHLLGDLFLERRLNNQLPQHQYGYFYQGIFV